MLASAGATEVEAQSTTKTCPLWGWEHPYPPTEGILGAGPPCQPVVPDPELPPNTQAWLGADEMSKAPKQR